MPEITFSKNEFQIWYFESFIFWSKYRFWGQLYDVLASAFLIFRRRPTMVADIFTQPSHHKKASYGPEMLMLNIAD